MKQIKVHLIRIKFKSCNEETFWVRAFRPPGLGRKMEIDLLTEDNISELMQVIASPWPGEPLYLAAEVDCVMLLNSVWIKERD